MTTIAYIAIGLVVWLGASALAVALCRSAALADRDAADGAELDVLGEAGNRSRDGWVK